MLKSTSLHESVPGFSRRQEPTRLISELPGNYSKVIAASKNDPLKRLSELLTTTDYLTMVMDAKDGQMR